MSVMKVLIVDDERIFRVMMREILASHPEVDVVGEAADGVEAIELAKQLKPDVVLMDIELGSEPNGIQAGHRIREFYPAVGIVLFSSEIRKDQSVQNAKWSYLL